MLTSVMALGKLSWRQQRIDWSSLRILIITLPYYDTVNLQPLESKCTNEMYEIV
jgi:hypothetical protein